MNYRYYKVAGMTVEVRSDFPISENTFQPKFRKFEVDGPGRDNILIHHHFHPPDLSSGIQSAGEEIYNKNQWKIHRLKNAWHYDFTSLFPIDPGHNATGIFNKDYTALSVHTVDFDKDSYRNASLPALTLFNNDQVMFGPLLCNRNGLILHSNGFDINGNGILLAGASGVGKTTLSGMLKKHGFKILCDDRIFITKSASGFRIHGNWCHGTTPDTAEGSAPLRGIFFLEHYDGNVIEEINDARQSSHNLLGALVHPFLPPTGWEKTFNIIEAMVQKVKCYRLRFDLSGDICNVISELLK